MATAASDMENDYESLRRASAVNELLRQIGLSSGGATDWWNFAAYKDLGNRTPTQAWLAGDEDAVRALVDKWYADTVATGKRLRSDPAFSAKVRTRLEKLRAVTP